MLEDEPKLINKPVFYDHRGTFAPLLFDSHRWIQSNISINNKKFTLRGLHYQENPYSQSKLIKIIQGNILDFIVDLRTDSKNYLKLYIFDMIVGDELYVPKNFAHGFLTKEAQTVVQYLVDSSYNPISERCFVWTEFPELLNHFNSIPEFSLEKIIINEKDLISNK